MSLDHESGRRRAGATLAGGRAERRMPFPKQDINNVGRDQASFIETIASKVLPSLKLG